MPHKLFRFYRFCVIGFRFIWTCWIKFWVFDFPFSFLFLFCKCGELCKTNIHEYWETFRTHAILILSIRKLKKKKQYWQAAAVTWNSPWNLWDYIQLELFIYGYVLLIFDYYFNGFITFYYYNFFRIIFCNGLLW